MRNPTDKALTSGVPERVITAITIAAAALSLAAPPATLADELESDPPTADANDGRDDGSDSKPPLSEAIPENTADTFGVEDLNRDELGADIGAERSVVVIDASESSDPTRYTIEVTGEIRTAEGDIAGFPVTINDEAAIDGEIATGRIESTVDAYYVYGEIRRIAVADPDVTEVWVDGERYEAERMTTAREPEHD